MYDTTAIDKKTQGKVEDILWDIADDWELKVLGMHHMGGVAGGSRGSYADYEMGKMQKYVDPKTWKLAERAAKLLNDAARRWYEETEDAITKEYGKEVWDIDYDDRLELNEYDPIFAGDIIELLLDQTVSYEGNIEFEEEDYIFSKIEGREIDNVLDELFEVRGWFALEYNDIVRDFFYV